MRSGCVAASKIAAGPPMFAQPNIAARFEPTSSRTAMASSVHCSSVGGSSGATGSECPVPRRFVDGRCAVFVIGEAEHLHLFGLREHRPVLGYAETLVTRSLDPFPSGIGDDLDYKRRWAVICQRIVAPLVDENNVGPKTLIV